MYKDKLTNIKNILIKNIETSILVETNHNTRENILFDKIANELKSKVKMVQFLPNCNSFSKNIEIGRKIHQLCSIYEALFIVQGRADMAKILDADGLILTDNDIDIKNALDIIGNDKLIAYYINSAQNQILDKFNQVDYVGIDLEIYSTLKLITDSANCKKIFIKRLN